MGRIVESALHRNVRGSVSGDTGQDMHGFECESGHAHQIHVAVDTPVQAKIAEIRGDSLGIGRIVAADCNRNASIRVCKRQSLDRVGNVEVKLVVPALMRSHERGPDPKRGCLTGTLKVQDRSTFDKGISQREPRAVPSLSTKIWLVGIARIIRIEAVGKNGGLPQARLFGPPNLPDAADQAATKFPSFIQPLDAFDRPRFCRSRHHGRSVQWSREHSTGS